MFIPSSGRLYYPSWHVIRGPVSKKTTPGPIPLTYFWTVLVPLILLPWPARSPDLSRIEHVLNMVGRHIRTPQNIADLEKQLARQNVSQNDITNLYHSLPRRIQAVSPPKTVSPTTDLSIQAVIVSRESTL
ncbi:hypothetical protein TNCV_2616241 [Trichonephila clavipes]|nr:hypothetical protein TNCV_2616241 [Trichonephila clavipes]